MARRIWDRCGKFLSSTEGKKEKIMKMKGEKYKIRQPTHKYKCIIIIMWTKMRLLHILSSLGLSCLPDAPPLDPGSHCQVTISPCV